MKDAPSPPSIPYARVLPTWTWAFVGIGLLVIGNAVHAPEFLRITVVSGHAFGSPIDIVSEASRPLVVALGMTLVIATGGVDLSVGSVVAIAGACAALVLRAGEPLPVALASALGAGLAAGAFNAILVAGLGLQPIIATLILMVAGRGIAQLLVGGNVIVITDARFEWFSRGTIAGMPVAPVLAVALFAVTALFLRKTAAGLFVEAVGDNETAGRFAGLSSGRVKACAYLFCGACAGFAGILAASNIRAADPYRAGENMELDAIFAVVIGGTALTGGRISLMGSLMGALFLQTLATTLYQLGVPPAIAPVPKALLILGVCLVQSPQFRQFLLSRRGRKEAS